MPTNVLIAGAGPAAVEAALALRRLAPSRVDVTLLAPTGEFVYRPLSVLSPFAAGGATTYPLARIAEDAGFEWVQSRMERVDVAGHEVVLVDGSRVAYDLLVVATGARPVEPFRGAVTFTGSLTDQERLHGIVQDVEGGYLHRIAFVVPSGATWALPLYELALMLAERAYSMGARLEIEFVTPEAAPLELFGDDVSRAVAAMLAEAGVTLRCGVLDEVPTADRVITLPRLVGPSVDGLPAGSDGFLECDGFGRVVGAPDVYAAGDVTTFPVKQGGIACQQADAVATHVAFRAGADVEPERFHAQLRGLLVTERWTRALGPADLEAKIAGRELAPYLAGLDAEVLR